MQIRIGDAKIEFANEVATVEKIFQAMFEEIGNSEMVISHINVDGVDVYNELDKYILNNIGAIQNIDVVLIHANQLIREILASTDDYLRRLIAGIHSLGAELYQGPSRQTWETFERLLEGMAWLYDSSTALMPYGDIFTVFQRDLSHQIKELQNALERSDLTLLADLITYEIMPLMERYLQMVTEIQSKEVN